MNKYNSRESDLSFAIEGFSDRSILAAPNKARMNLVFLPRLYCIEWLVSPLKFSNFERAPWKCLKLSCPTLYHLVTSIRSLSIKLSEKFNTHTSVSSNVPVYFLRVNGIAHGTSGQSYICVPPRDAWECCLNFVILRAPHSPSRCPFNILLKWFVSLSNVSGYWWVLIGSKELFLVHVSLVLSDRLSIIDDCRYAPNFFFVWVIWFRLG